MNDRTYLTPTEACTLIAHEAVILLDTVETEVPSCVSEFRTAVDAMNTVYGLGKDGEALLAWMDVEVKNAQRYIDDGTNLPNLIDLCRMDTVPDAVAQMELVWLLFDTAAKEECGPEQRRALMSTARTITEMCGLDDLLRSTLKPNAAALASALDTALSDIHDGLRSDAGPCAGSAHQELQ